MSNRTTCAILRTWETSFELQIVRDSRFGWHVQLTWQVQMLSSAHNESPEKMTKTASLWLWQSPSQGLCGGHGTTCFIFPELPGIFKGRRSPRTQIDDSGLAHKVLIPCKTLCFEVLCKFGKFREVFHPGSWAFSIHTCNHLLVPIWSEYRERLCRKQLLDVNWTLKEESRISSVFSLNFLFFR